MKRTSWKTVFVLSIAALALAVPRLSLSQAASKEEEKIVEQIDRIFTAYIQQDAGTLRATHAKDWVGFKGPSRDMLKGIDDYMKDITFKNAHMVEYKIEDIEVRIRGNFGVAYYVATWKSRITASGQVMSVRARSVDVYEKQDGQWIQVGSNLNFMPARGFLSPGVDKYYQVTIEKDSK